MRKLVIIIMVCSLLFVKVPTANAMFASSNIPFLVQIVTNTMETIVQLSRIFNMTKETVEMQRRVQEGINATLRRLDVIATVSDKATWRDIRSATDAVKRVQDLFGDVIKGPSHKRIDHVDQVTSEALIGAKEMEDFGAKADQISLDLHNQSLTASPMRAMQLNAQGTSALLAAQAQGHRNDAQMIKLLSTMVSIENRKEKIQAINRQTQFGELSQHLSRSRFHLTPMISK